MYDEKGNEDPLADGTNFVIKAWFFGDNTTPSNIDIALHPYGPFSSAPDPKMWNAKPYVTFDNRQTETNPHTSCKMKNLQLIINIALCGAWAGATMADDEPYMDPSCPEGICDACEGDCCYQYIRGEHIDVGDPSTFPEGHDAQDPLKNAFFKIGKFAIQKQSV